MHLSRSSSANSSDKLSMPQPHGCGGLNFEYTEELFTSQVGSMDQFDWFKDFNVGFFTTCLASYIERLRPFNTHGDPFSYTCLVHF